MLAPVTEYVRHSLNYSFVSAQQPETVTSLDFRRSFGSHSWMMHGWCWVE